MCSKPFEVLHVGGVSITGNHVVLADLARDLVRSLDGCFETSRAIVLHVGAHRSTRLSDQGEAIQIGIQTEQMRDANGHVLWKIFRRKRLSRMVGEFDLLLDLSLDNAVVYDALTTADHSKLRFGPYIFPLKPPPPRLPGRGLLFVGAMNERRSHALHLQGKRAIQVPMGTFGQDLDLAMEQAEGLLNLHRFEGEYTEYPRILKAVLSGRAVWSEPLASPMVEGVHYFAPDCRPTEEEVMSVQKSMSHLLCGRYSLWSFLQREIGN